MSASTICHGCGQRLTIPADYQRAKMRCPECGVMCDVPPPDERKPRPKPAARRSAPVAPPAPKPPPPQPTAPEKDLPVPLLKEPGPPPPAPTEIEFSDDPDDGKPYRVSPTEPKCPQCGLRLEPKATQCPGCGCDLRTGKKPKRSYQPAELSWEAGMPLRRRTLLFMLGVVLGIALGVPISIASESWMGGVISWIVFIVLTAFLLGTYPRVELSRNKRGKVTLKKIWRVCFVERPPISFDVLEFSAVRTGYASDVSAIDWMIAIMLLPAGIVPAIVWWYVFIQRDQHTVTLVREHGYGSDVLYRGVSEDMAKEMACALEDVGGLPYENRS
jgi:hypothetical protein